jgi:hypothetical protein
MRAPSLAALTLALAAACDATAPQQLNLCQSWLIQRDAGWDTLTAQTMSDELPAVVTIASLTGQDVITLTADELIAMSGTAALGCTQPAAAAANLVAHGTVANVPADKRFVVKAAGAVHTLVSPTTFDLKVPDGKVDVLAYTSAIPPFPTATFQLPEKLIFRRDVTYADGATIPVLDFGSAEAFTLESAALTAELQQPAAGENIRFFSGPNSIDMRSNTTLSTTLVGMPEAQLREGDYHLLTLFGAGGATSQLYYRRVIPSVAALGAASIAGSASALATTPCIRSRIIIPIQTDYSSFASAKISWFGTGAGSVTMTVTRAAMGDATFWAVEVPDFGDTCIVPAGRTLAYSATVGGGRLAVFRGVTGDQGERLLTATTFISPP